MPYAANNTQKETIIQWILAATPYTPESGLYKRMQQDLRRISFDTLWQIRQTQKDHPTVGDRRMRIAQEAGEVWPK